MVAYARPATQTMTATGWPIKKLLTLIAVAICISSALASKNKVERREHAKTGTAAHRSDSHRAPTTPSSPTSAEGASPLVSASQLSSSSSFLGWDRLCITGESAAHAPAAVGVACAVHKPLLPSFEPVDAVAAVFLFFVAALALSGGIGGGAIFVPTLSLLLRFRATTSTGLSQSLICGASIGAFLVNAFSSHPHDASRPLIDLPLTAFLAPMEMAGALVGAQLNAALPPLLTLCVMVLILGATAVQTTRTGLKMREREREAGRLSGASAGGHTSPDDVAEASELLRPEKAVNGLSRFELKHRGSSCFNSSRSFRELKHRAQLERHGAHGGGGTMEYASVDRDEKGGKEASVDGCAGGCAGGCPGGCAGEGAGGCAGLGLTLSVGRGGGGSGGGSGGCGGGSGVKGGGGGCVGVCVGRHLRDGLSRHAGDGEHDADADAESGVSVSGEMGLSDTGVLSPRGDDAEEGVQRYGGYSAVGAAGALVRRRRIRDRSVLLLGATWSALLLLLLLRGGKGAPSVLGTPACGVTYWALTLLALTLLAGSSVLGGVWLLAQTAESASSSSSSSRAEGDVAWTAAMATRCAAQTAAAGVVAGLMGVGGGLLLGPLMLQMGILPQVSTATTATMILLTSSSASAAFILASLVPLDYSIVFGTIAMLGAFLGKRFIGHLLRKHNCASFIILLLASLIVSSVFGIGAMGFIGLKQQMESGSFSQALALRPLCVAK